MPVDENIVALEKGLIEITGQVGNLLNTTAKLETSVASISDAMQILARKEVIVEQHTKDISALSVKVAENEKQLKDIATDIHSRCELSSKEVSNVKVDVEEKMEGYVVKLHEKIDVSSWKMLLSSIAVAMFLSGGLFTYIQLSKAEHAEHTAKLYNSVEKLGVLITNIDKTMSNIAIKQDYMSKQIEDEREHKHEK